MTIEQFGLSLTELYHMDEITGIWPHRLKKFENVERYSKWAASELEAYVADRLYPRHAASYREFWELTFEFMTRMEYFATLNKNTSYIFEAAALLSADVLDWLDACG